MGEDILENRRNKLFTLLKTRKNIWIYLVLILIVILGFNIRTRNLDVLNGYLADPDAHAFFRYAKYIVEHGSMPELDRMRYYPIGFDPRGEFGFLSYYIAYLYKFLHFFNRSLTLEFVDIIFPAITFIFGAIFFFLLVRRLFDYRVALLATTCLTIVPAFLFRTMSGVSDKEALALPLMFLSLYLYLVAWQSKKALKVTVFAILSGVATGLTALAWGGVVYVLVAIGGFAFFESLLLKFDKRDSYTYVLWAIVSLLIMTTLGRFSISTIASSLTTAIILFSFLLVVVNFIIVEKDFLKLRTRLEKFKIHLGISTFLVSLAISYLITSIAYSFNHIPSLFFGVIRNIITPLKNRWALTVAESHEPYITNWFGDFGKIFVYLFIIASIVLFYEMVKNVKKYKFKLTTVYTLFILGFVFSRYSPSSRLNGENFLSNFIFFGSIILILFYFGYVYIVTYLKDRETFEQLRSIDKKYSLIFIWFILGIVGARTAIRLIFPFAPITAFLFSFLVFWVVDYIKISNKVSNRIAKIVSYAIVVLVVVFLFSGFMKTTLAQSKYIGPIYNQQWQQAGNWVKENTPKDAVFVHWWDYGYLVQTGFERATVTDGGNAIGPWNHYVGRHVLTAQSEQEPLSFLKTHDVSYLLIVSDEIGKYPAYSSIGSDENYDRYSWIGVYTLSQDVQETRNQTILLYQGGIALDEDFVYNGQVLPRQNAGIAGFFLPVGNDNDKTSIFQPTAVIVYNGKRYDVPLECVFVNDKEILFEQKGIPGCLRIIPSIDDQNRVNPNGAAIYLSPRVRKTLFAKLYIYGLKSDIFELVYSDDDKGAPLALWRGRIIGPLKIWKVDYPTDVKTDPKFLETAYSNLEVTYVKQGYY